MKTEKHCAVDYTALDARLLQKSQRIPPQHNDASMALLELLIMLNFVNSAMKRHVAHDAIDASERGMTDVHIDWL
jgi:hypothetical protein